MKGVKRPLPEGPWFRTQAEVVTRHFFASHRGEGEGGFEPPVDLVEGEDALVVELDLPGVDPSSLSVSLQAGRLVVKGNKAGGAGMGRARFLLVERLSGPFCREIDLPLPVNPSRATARISQGVLSVHLPRVSDKRSVRHEIKVERREETER